MIDEKTKLSDLIDPGVLQELQKSFALNNNSGIIIFDENYNRITTSNICFFENSDMEEMDLEAIGLLFQPKLLKNPQESSLSGKTHFSHILHGQFTRILSPLYFQDQLLLIISILIVNEPIKDLKKLVSQLQKLYTKNTFSPAALNEEVIEPESDLFNIVNSLKSHIMHFLEAGYERAKISKNENEDSIQNQSGPDLNEDTCIFFTTPGHVIIDATPNILQTLGFTDSQKVIGENIIDRFILLSEEQSTIKKYVQKNGELDWYSTIIKTNNNHAIHTRVKIVPQTANELIIGYEYHFDLIPEPQNKIHPAEVKTETTEQMETNQIFEPAEAEEENILDAAQVNPFLTSFKGVADMFDAMPNPLFILDDNNKICVWNQLLENTLNISQVSVMGAGIADLLMTESRSLIKLWLDEFRTQNMKRMLPQKEISFIDGSGNIFKTRLSLAKTTILAKQYITVILREWQNKAGSSKIFQHYIKNLVDSAFATLITNESGTIIYANESALRFLTIEENLLLNKNIQNFLREEEVEFLKKCALPEKESTKQFNTQLLPDFGNGKSIKIVIKKLETPNTQDRYLLWVLKTHAKEKREPLPKEGLNKTQKLEYLRVVFQKIAFNFDKIANDLTANISEIELNENVDMEIKDKIQNIKKIAKKTSNIHQNLLYFSHTEKPELEKINLNSKIQQWQNSFKQAFPDSVTLEFNLKKDIGHIQANPRQLKHILKTLVRNAAESYSTGGKIFIHTRNHFATTDEISEGMENTGKSFVVLEVIDSGRGIPMTIREQLFEPFATTNSHDAGRGLGLASVYGIIKNHNGFIAVKTLDGQGTIVSLFFPMVEQGKLTEEMNKETDTILLIDDDPGIIEVNSITLKHFGFATRSATSAQKGIELFKSNIQAISIVILDISLPDMNGIKCAEAIRKLSPDVPIILSSGYHCDDQYYEFMQKSGAVWLQKPYTSNKLYQVIQDLLTKK